MKRTVRTYQVLLTVIFSGLISFSLLNNVVHFYKVPETSETENRKLSSKPVFAINTLDSYSKLYESYFNDQFPFRSEIGLLNTLICYFYLHQSPLPGQVELGKEGWLFLDQKESEVYQGKFELDDIEVDSVVKVLHDRTLEYQKKGMKFYVAFPPMKPEIYPEFLPPDFRRAPNGTITDKVVKAIKNDGVIQYIDLKEALLNAKGQGRLFGVTDNHWNWVGAYWGYFEIVSRIRKDFPKITPLTMPAFHFKSEEAPPGRLANMIGLSKYLKEIEFYPVLDSKKSKPVDSYHEKPAWASQIPNYESIASTGDASLPGIVIIHDSFTDAMKVYFDETFNTTTYLFDGWRYQTNNEIIDVVKPEIVLLVIFEPHIPHLVGRW